MSGDRASRARGVMRGEIDDVGKVWRGRDYRSMMRIDRKGWENQQDREGERDRKGRGRNKTHRSH